MLYSEYKLAAEKHVKTCLGIVEAIDNLTICNKDSLLASKNKQFVLHNLFYLSGYVLESISTYAVYKHYRWRNSKSIKIKDDGFSSVCDLSFYKSDNYQFYIQEHRFQVNQFEVLKVPFSSSGIPFIDSSASVEIEMQILFNTWAPELRYHNANKKYPYLITKEIALDDIKVGKFIKLTYNIYNSLIQLVG